MKRNYQLEMEEEIERLRYHHRQVLSQIRKESQVIEDIICRKRMNRKALSEAADRIGTITWRELNV